MSQKPHKHSPLTQRLGPFRRVLIANRGEIALRVIRAVRELGLESVAIYSDADENSLHRFQADYAVRLKGVSSADTYLRIDRIIEAMKASGADALHPGYGFLSENSELARSVYATGAVFIGPPPEATELMGHKVHARNLMVEHGVPVVPGCIEPLKDLADLRRMSKEVGFPMILKAASGGGGRGMRVVWEDKDLEPSLLACQREAKSYFGNPEVFCERYIEHPRHIEFQVLFDGQGNGVHLFERDCTVQRRHQKLLEEAPSPYLSHAKRMEVGDKALAAARAAGYVGAGTIEFICESPEKIYFMEMNTRIQVEHPVTEMITGVDLIKAQLRIAQGESLWFGQDDLKINGWSMEARINAEDPQNGFAPCPGVIDHVVLPGGPFVRTDTHIYPGYKIPDAYDSMIAKLIVWGQTRDEAMQRMARALSEFQLHGVTTTINFHEALLRHPSFQQGKLTTRFIEENKAYWDSNMTRDCDLEPLEAACVAATLMNGMLNEGRDHAL